MTKRYFATRHVTAEEFDGSKSCANRLGISWDSGNGYVGDPAYTGPADEPCWYIDDESKNVIGYDENLVNVGDFIVTIDNNTVLILSPSEFEAKFTSAL
jgi:hypothetical protein